MKKTVVAGLLFICIMAAGTIPVAQSIGLGDILKVGGIGYLIDRFAGPINSFINTLTLKNGVGSDYATKVVPILTLGSGGYIGAAQVMGPKDLVDKTQAVLQLEGDFNNQIRVKALVPINSKSATNFSRVNGVGVSATIDFRI